LLAFASSNAAQIQMPGDLAYVGQQPTFVSPAVMPNWKTKELDGLTNVLTEPSSINAALQAVVYPLGQYKPGE